MKKSIFILSAMFILGACSSDSAQKVTEKIKNAYSEGLRKTFIKEGIKSCIENSGLKESEAREYCEGGSDLRLSDLASGFGSTFRLATLASTHGLRGHVGSLQVAV